MTCDIAFRARGRSLNAVIDRCIKGHRHAIRGVGFYDTCLPGRLHDATEI